MQEVFEKIIEELEELKSRYEYLYEKCNEASVIQYDLGRHDGILKAIEIVKQEAEKYDNGWIPCSERLPEESFGCLVTVMDCEPSTQTEFENILPYFVGYDGHRWNDADGEEIPFEVIAWQKLPQPYTKGE